ncbi:Nitrogen fixation protein VnfA [compost metagenome]
MVPVHIAPLRERPEDIIPLAQHFIEKYQLASDVRKRLSHDARHALLAWHWPGNVRELENVIQRGLILSHSPDITARDLALPVSVPKVIEPAEQPRKQKAAPLLSSIRFAREHGRHAEYQYIIALLRQHNGNKSQTAQSLGITPRALRYRLASMRGDGIDPSYFN